MSSFTRFLSKASSALSGIAGALGMNGGGCTFTLSGDGKTVTFPVLPASFTVTNPRNNQTINVINIGDVNVIGNAGLATLKFESFFPANDYPFVQGGGLGSRMFGGLGGLMNQVKDPYTYVQQIKDMQAANTPCQITITGTDVSMPVTVETFEYGEKDGSGDVSFSLSLREYRYLTPASGGLNSVTGLKGRIGGALKEKVTSCLPGLDTMDNAAKSLQRTASIAKQCQRTLKLYKAMAKSGGVRGGVLITSTIKGIQAGGTSLVKW